MRWMRWACAGKGVVAIVVALACHSGAALAAADDEFRSGSDAFRRGDVVEAMAILKKPADAGYAPAQALLAYILDKAEFNDEAVAYYRKAAAQGDRDGEYGLGTMYASGEGVKRDPVEARNWITRAAEKGHANAINTLALAFINGDLGIDETQRGSADALRWVRRAAEADFLPAIVNLAQAYRSGAYGLAISIEQAAALDARARKIRGVSERNAAKKGR